jgi:WD repeat-containing protein 35
MAQRQLYSGQYRAALKTAIRVTEYELEIDTKQVYSLLALVAYYNKHWRECSRAFVKLEHLSSLSEEEKEKYENLAAKIFSK